jgi:hypothetical protein
MRLLIGLIGMFLVRARHCATNNEVANAFHSVLLSWFLRRVVRSTGDVTNIVHNVWIFRIWTAFYNASRKTIRNPLIIERPNFYLHEIVNFVSHKVASALSSAIIARLVNGGLPQSLQGASS